MWTKIDGWSWSKGEVNGKRSECGQWGDDLRGTAVENCSNLSGETVEVQILSGGGRL